MVPFALTLMEVRKLRMLLPSVIDYINGNFISNVLDFTINNLADTSSLVCFGRNLDIDSRTWTDKCYYNKFLNRNFLRVAVHLIHQIKHQRSYTMRVYLHYVLAVLVTIILVTFHMFA